MTPTANLAIYANKKSSRSTVKLLAIGLIAGFLIPSSLAAQDDESLPVPTASRFMVHIDVKALRKTKIGGRLFEMAKQAALEEINDDEENTFETIRESLGFDPFTELDGITIVGTDYEEPQEELQVVVRLRKTSGNLEGMMLALPDYESTDYGKYQVHSARPDEDEQVFAAIHTNKKGNKSIVAARSLSSVKSLLDMLDGKGAMKTVKLSRKNREFIHVEVLELPIAELGEGPQTNIAKMVQGVSLKMSDQDDSLRLNLTLKAKKEQQAKQLRQLMQGGIAMAQLIQSDDHDEDLVMLKRILQTVDIKRDGNDVNVKLAIPEKQIIDLIENEMELSLFN